MSSSKKVFTAVTIIVAGYGVAFLLGRPVESDRPPAVHPVQLSVNYGLPTESRSAPVVQALEPVIEGARLVPDAGMPSDTQSMLSNTARADFGSRFIAENQPKNSGQEFATDSSNGSAPSLEFAPPALAPRPVVFGASPRAKLRNEAPRPLDYGGRSQNTTRLLPATVEADVPISNNTSLANASQSPAVAPGNFEAWIGQPMHGPVVTEKSAVSSGSVSKFGAMPADARLAPLQHALSTEDNQPRTHIVCDGDSLAKLAGRYLDDPHRAAEIFEFNRQLLSDPELLPIGVELVIPPRAGVSSPASYSPQSYVPPSVAIHFSSSDDLVPIRPVPATSNVAPPRAIDEP